jgi:hypothetical protein
MYCGVTMWQSSRRGNRNLQALPTSRNRGHQNQFKINFDSFDYREIVHQEFIPHGPPVNQKFLFSSSGTSQDSGLVMWFQNFSTSASLTVTMRSHTTPSVKKFSRGLGTHQTTSLLTCSVSLLWRTIYRNYILKSRKRFGNLYPSF